ncbi:MAG: HipA domain-containing protein [Desulfobacula sp.]|uniref:type II toxin-antitoxin system HipA family toxin n=1 Tax=Desulfobacula sp. TaxID=2593537 RepID=UPI0025B887A6|nr:HipA domain-containing protein [Desulfobacula sp.]MCD4719481.1 HipA domain-containing protein [Desulfobacula sp.]
MPEKIFVHIDLAGKPHFVGRLWLHARRGQESASFEYSSGWKSSPVCFSLEPALIVDEGKFHIGKSLFGSISDSAPDRWGRSLMNRMETRKAKIENRRARRLKESDYLLMVDDRTRQGALRFSTSKDGPFLASYTDNHIPPLIQLGKLLNASNRIVVHKEIDQDLRDIVEPGSSLGGARPKVVVTDTKTNLLIAKFPSPKDEWDVGLWEFLSLRMAKKAGIPVPDFRIEKVLGKNVLLLGRFDRKGEQIRVPFLSAMSMLGASDGDTKSYIEIGEVLKEYGASTSEDLIDLWRRIVFNIMISNVDDHLRNHGFLYEGISGWRLSPIYDLEPTPDHIKARILRTNIDLYNGTASLDLAYEVVEYFGLNIVEARKIAKEVANAVKNWDKEASRFGASKQEIDFMRSAFDHDDLRQGLGKRM